MKRAEFKTVVIRLVSPVQIETAHNKLNNIPLDSENPLEMVLREVKKLRGADANSRMWAGPLKEIADQAWVNRRQFSAEVWHEFFKAEFLPEDDHPELSLLAKDGYRKWDDGPKGNRVLVGSTTALLKRGFALYLQQVEAYGASLGVMFHEHEGRYA